jgi:hypothetical protein
MLQRLNIINYLLLFSIAGFDAGIYLIFRYWAGIISLLVIGGSWKAGISKSNGIVLILWIMYFFSLLKGITLDWVNLEQFCPYDRTKYVRYFFLSGLLPWLSVALSRNISILFVKRTVVFGLIIFAILTFYFGREVSDGGSVNGRLGGSENIQAGLTGALSMGLFALGIFGTRRRKTTTWLFALLGFRNWFLSGTRSAVLGFLFVLLKNLGRNPIFLFAVLLLSIFVLKTLVNLGFDSITLRRLELSNLSFLMNGRDLLWLNAWDHIVDSPIFGGNFVLTKGFGAGFYPHNLFLDAFMATGLLGFGITLRVVWSVLRIDISDQSTKVVLTVWLVFLGYAFISQALYRMTHFWLLTGILLNTRIVNENFNRYRCVQ